VPPRRILQCDAPDDHHHVAQRAKIRELLKHFAGLRGCCDSGIVHDYFVAAIDLRKSETLYKKNASPIPPTIAKLRHTASSPPPR
jgi:hypothetical protein